MVVHLLQNLVEKNYYFLQNIYVISKKKCFDMEKKLLWRII